MITRCPGCGTRYQIDTRALVNSDGLAQCLRCDTVFDVTSEQARDAGDVTPHMAAHVLQLDAASEIGRGSEAAIDDRAPAERELPFEMPENLVPLEASTDGAIDVADTLYEKPSHRGLIYGVIAVLLLLALGTQLAWQYRTELLESFPQLGFVCEHIRCQPEVIHDPRSYQVMQREIRPTENVPGSLTLNATIRNDASIAQHLPDIQLSLIDSNGSVLIRRRLAPDDYLFPRPPDGLLVEPGEVFTIGIDFEDPGHVASGFSIEFF